jgi:predicted metal-dependent phosphoesterase TrpH
MGEAARLMRCDLHVHSRYSGAATVPVLRHLTRECYSEPAEVYAVARGRGMDLVTLSDHDTIAGGCEIESLPGTFLSEEVTCFAPSGGELHLGVFDIRERDHDALQSRRRDLESFFAYTAERRIPVCLNHPFSALTGRRGDDDLARALGGATHLEALNGMMSPGSNHRAWTVARRARLAPCGGSDAHTLATVARAHTCVLARDRMEFLAGLRAGLTIPAGRSGSYARLTADVTRLAGAACLDQASLARSGDARELTRLFALAALLPFTPLLPLFTAFTYADEQLFAWRHFRRHVRAQAPPARRRPPMIGAPAAGTSAP